MTETIWGSFPKPQALICVRGLRLGLTEKHHFEQNQFATNWHVVDLRKGSSMESHMLQQAKN